MNRHFGCLSSDWADVKEIILFGAGKYFHTYYNEIKERVKIRFIIDNSPRLQNVEFDGIKILSLPDAMKQINGTKIVIMAETTAQGEMRNALLNKSFVEYRDFTNFERFICEWGYMHLRRVELLEVHTAVTTRCTFNCKKCNMFIPHYKKSERYSFNSLKISLDFLFRYVDTILKYQVVGGEPFLNEELADFIEYVHSTYGNRIAHFRIISNGSVMPKHNLIMALKRANCEVHLSDYRESIKYSETFNRVQQELEKNGIDYTIIPSLRWRDIGFPQNPKTFSSEEARRHMLECGTSWHGLIDGRLYYCNVAWSAEKCGLFKNQPDDYIDLQELSIDRDSKEKILALCLGDFAKSYNSFCQVCGGCGQDNTDFVPAGEQC